MLQIINTELIELIQNSKALQKSLSSLQIEKLIEQTQKLPSEAIDELIQILKNEKETQKEKIINTAKKLAELEQQNNINLQEEAKKIIQEAESASTMQEEDLESSLLQSLENLEK